MPPRHGRHLMVRLRGNSRATGLYSSVSGEILPCTAMWPMSTARRTLRLCVWGFSCGGLLLPVRLQVCAQLSGGSFVTCTRSRETGLTWIRSIVSGTDCNATDGRNHPETDVRDGGWIKSVLLVD
jgi:hypothetical protein